jgi:hypothetical protein
VGLMYGVAGDMWLDLYFFLAGIAVFSLGRLLEKRHQTASSIADPSDYLIR